MKWKGAVTNPVPRINPFMAVSMCFACPLLLSVTPARCLQLRDLHTICLCASRVKRAGSSPALTKQKSCLNARLEACQSVQNKDENDLYCSKRFKGSKKEYMYLAVLTAWPFPSQKGEGGKKKAPWMACFQMQHLQSQKDIILSLFLMAEAGKIYI